jgi:hypothetical protein
MAPHGVLSNSSCSVAKKIEKMGRFPIFSKLEEDF